MEDALDAASNGDQPLVTPELLGVDGDESAVRDSSPPPGIYLPDGQALDAERALPITRAAPTRVIVLAGDVASGKTTILASLYDRFQRGPFAGFGFAGSRTLVAFEQRCHLSRNASRRSTPATERTIPRPGDQLLHLRVASTVGTEPPQDLLFTDLSGETFRYAKDSPEGCRSLPILLRADHFVLLVDGNGLLDPAVRQVAMADVRGLLRSCLDSEMLTARILVDVLITKKDLLLGSHEDQRKARTFIDDVVKPTFERHFASRVGRLRISEVAARPVDNSLELAHGLESVFPSWVRDVPAEAKAELGPELALGSGREFDRFLLKMRLGGY